MPCLSAPASLDKVYMGVPTHGRPEYETYRPHAASVHGVPGLLSACDAQALPCSDYGAPEYGAQLHGSGGEQYRVYGNLTPGAQLQHACASAPVQAQAAPWAQLPALKLPPSSAAAPRPPLPTRRATMGSVPYVPFSSYGGCGYQGNLSGGGAPPNSYQHAFSPSPLSQGEALMADHPAAMMIGGGQPGRVAQTGHVAHAAPRSDMPHVPAQQQQLHGSSSVFSASSSSVFSAGGRMRPAHAVAGLPMSSSGPLSLPSHAHPLPNSSQPTAPSSYPSLPRSHSSHHSASPCPFPAPRSHSTTAVPSLQQPIGCGHQRTRFSHEAPCVPIPPAFLDPSLPATFMIGPYGRPMSLSPSPSPLQLIDGHAREATPLGDPDSIFPDWYADMEVPMQHGPL